MRVRIVVAAVLLSATYTASDLAQSPNDQKAAKEDLPTAQFSATCGPRNQLSSAQFQALLQTVRDAWLAGQADKVVACFAPGAIFSVPPSPAVVGHENLLHIFAVGPKTEPPKNIAWHHVVFDPGQQIGVAEFSMQRRVPSHGVVIIKISGGLISNWREYATASDLTWEKFIGLNDF